MMTKARHLTALLLVHLHRLWPFEVLQGSMAKVCSLYISKLAPKLVVINLTGRDIEYTIQYNRNKKVSLCIVWSAFYTIVNVVQKVNNQIWPIVMLSFVPLQKQLNSHCVSRGSTSVIQRVWTRKQNSSIVPVTSTILSKQALVIVA